MTVVGRGVVLLILEFPISYLELVCFLNVYASYYSSHSFLDMVYDLLGWLTELYGMVDPSQRWCNTENLSIILGYPYNYLCSPTCYGDLISEDCSNIDQHKACDHSFSVIQRWIQWPCGCIECFPTALFRMSTNSIIPLLSPCPFYSLGVELSKELPAWYYHWSTSLYALVYRPSPQEID